MAGRGAHTPQAASENTQLVSFQVEAVLKFGEEVHVCGDTPALGLMDVAHSTPLFTTPATFPIWKSAVTPIPRGKAVRYRYAVFSGGKFSRWEDCRERLLVPTDVTRVQADGTNEQITATQDVLHKLSADAGTVAPSVLGAGAATPSINDLSMAPGPSTHGAIGLSDGVLVVSYYLPVLVSKNEDGTWHVEWDLEALLSLKTQLRVTRIGTVRFRGGVPVEERASLTEVLAQSPFNCVPIFIEEDQARLFYDTFCKQTLWPVFHNLLEIYGPSPTAQAGRFHSPSDELEHDAWQAYTSVQRIFKNKVVEYHHEGDLIWIHGFHLLLLPTFLSKAHPTAKIGLFLHTPFPSSEIFRTLSRREDLLRGMLSADQVGFHLFEYARHFLTCCRRLLGLEWTHEKNGINIRYGGRSVLVTCIHAGMDHDVVHSVLQKPEVQADMHQLMQRTLGKTVLAGIDRMERLKGIPLKLLAFERFLESHPELADKVLLFQVCLSAKERGEDYDQTHTQVQFLVERINKTFGRGGEPVVIYEERQEPVLQLKDRLALLSVADVFVVTTVRDGLNRWPFEYVLAQAAMVGQGSEYLPKPHDAGVMVLSEFTSCMRVLHGALHANPWRISEVAQALYNAVVMPAEERKKRLDMDVEYVQLNTTASWCGRLLQDLKGVVKDTNHLKYVAVGFGLTQRVSAMEAGFNAMDASSVVKKYRAAKSRLILLDYGGTIYDDQATNSIFQFSVATKVTKRNKPSPTTLISLADLCKDPKNQVYILSGKQRHDVEEALGHIPGLGLVAEAGFFFRRAGAGSGNREWRRLIAAGDQTWKDLSRAVMEVYMERTHGVYLQESESAVVWQFRDADPDFGHIQSKELEDQLNSVLKSYPIEVIRGDDYIEVRPAGISKSHFIDRLLEEFREVPGFCLCIGDDPSDENSYRVVKAFAQKHSVTQSYFTATVGKKPTVADSYLNETQDVVDMLETMGKSQLFDRSLSHVELQSAAFTPSRAHPATIRYAPIAESGAQATPPFTSTMGRSQSVPVMPTVKRPSSMTLNEYFNNLATPGLVSAAPEELAEEEADEGVWF